MATDPPVRYRGRSRLRRMAAELTPPIKGACNAINKAKSRCKYKAGLYTDHPGTGLCWVHDDPARVDTIRRYRSLKNLPIRRRLRQMDQMEDDVLNLVPEVQLIRAIVMDYVERYTDFSEALLAWYHDSKQKPRHMVTLSDAVNAIESISRVVERVHRIQERGSISLDTFRRILEQMGIIVAKYVKDGVALESIEQDWSRLALDAKHSVTTLPQHTTQTSDVKKLTEQAALHRAAARTRTREPDVDDRDDSE